jgi:hypothetical protein
MNKFVNELHATEYIDGNKHRYNKRHLSKEASIYFFLENCKECLKRGTGDYFLPDDLEEITNELFSLNNVYVALYPWDDYFNKEGEFVTECSTHCYKSLSSREVVNSVKSYLEKKDAVIYMYSYYGIMADIFVDNEKNNVKTYWWRMITKKEE